ncbi:hypothetical protein EJ02DRAFT_410615 [Clathrospora elynae]|uniref:Uncharacterized protein n=1 Tax=Clathrospora elynae TaxID=706981 RepID=A0A6A5SM30_9PLEO|nr:hypothetical protein EJ02DRAFT_410615 [Clathrospora elynae]
MTQSTSYRRPRDSIFNAFDRSHTSQKIELPISRWDEASSRKTVLFALPEYPPATSADIRVKVFLKPGRSWPFEFVTSIELHDDSATMRTSIGLSMQLEGWSSISAISENHDTMAVQMPKGSADGFTANVIIPPLCSYSVAKVIDVKEKAGITGWTIIDTAEAVLEVSDGNYLVKRKYFESVVIIENTS